MSAVLLFISIVLHCTVAQRVTVSITDGNESPYLTRQDERINLTCTAVDLPAGMQHYQWLFRSKMLGAELYETVESEVSSSLIIDSVSYLHHLGDYYCRVTSGGHSFTSNIFQLLAEFAAIIPVDNMEVVYVVENEPAVLECVEVLPPNEEAATVTIGWKRVSDNRVMSEHASGNNILRIEQATEADSGEYRCQLYTKYSGSEDADIRLVVITLPEFFYLPVDSTIDMGESHELYCGLVQTDSPVNFTWHLNGQSLPHNERLSVSTDLDTQRSTLHIRGVTYAESGSYECIASNSAGSAGQLHQVTVRGPPVLTLHANNTSLVIPISQNVKMLDCPYLAYPAPMVNWLKSNQALVPGTGKYRIFENGSLLISDLAIEDSGDYMCIIHNSVGVDEASYNLLIIGPPAPPESIEVIFMDGDPREVVISWRAPSYELNRPLEGYLLYYHMEGESPQEIEQRASNSELQIGSLFPGETYQVSLHAFNTVGGSQPVTANFTLPASAPAMTFNVSTLPDGYSVLAQWQLLYDGGPSIDTFTIKVYVVKSIQLLIYSTDADVTGESKVLSGLEPTTQYMVEVFISNSRFNEVMTFAVNTSAAPPGQPSTPHITLTTTHIFEITFTVLEGSESLTGLLLNTSEVLDNGKSLAVQTLIDINDHLYVESLEDLPDGEKKIVLVIGGLKQLQQYTFRVAAISAIGQGLFSEPSTPESLDDGRILYFIIFGVVGGAMVVIVIIIVVAMVMLRTTKQIQRTKRTLSINGGASPRGMPKSFVLQSPPAEHRRPSFQATNLNDCSSSHCDTPLSSVSNYKHHMLSSSTGETAPIYDRLCDLQQVDDSVSNGSDKRNGSISSDGTDGQTQDSAQNSSTIRQIQPVEKVVVDMYSSEGRIDSVTHNFAGNGASAQPSPPHLRPPHLYPTHLHSSAGQLQVVKSTHSLYQPAQQLQQVSRQKLPTSLHQLPVISQQRVTTPVPPQHLLCPPTFAAGSSPAINCRRSCDSILDGYKPTSYMTDV